MRTKMSEVSNIEMMNLIKTGLLEVVVAATSTTHNRKEEGRKISRSKVSGNRILPVIGRRIKRMSELPCRPETSTEVFGLE